jgi:hypothetical protein
MLVTEAEEPIQKYSQQIAVYNTHQVFFMDNSRTFLQGRKGRKYTAKPIVM